MNSLCQNQEGLYNLKVVKILDKTTFRLYILSMSKIIIKNQKKVLGLLSGKIEDFYLAGGTALSLFYFQHRDSFDLDFFTQKFNRVRVLEVIELLSSGLKRKVEIISEQSGKGKLKIIVANIKFSQKEFLKIDFVQDYLDFIKPPKVVDGIKISSLEDIYLKKIFTIGGTLPSLDEIGRSIRLGGRQEAKDFYDLFYLSNTFMRLSDFSFRYCNRLTRESIIHWFRSYGRMNIKTGLLELILRDKDDYKVMEAHFKKEIDRILEREIGRI